ncbi:DUF4097 domain-containing protein [Aliifodinibius sp. S!AR15-10]|uniref:DUF4097 family beta strand repeat-containing protein n=1 Tax=Aliifodinibius sp. S!AR15-10 TaxID=2950437 RepID=UPI002858FF94|nr:DUF4097 family beta strand repeat-containing protein [Aliifodinibius sp. S!AR15-10]MDR8390527.1 DUF4097 domain-containing protein [Aliifodinibius sp. S!AR15-10]
MKAKYYILFGVILCLIAIHPAAAQNQIAVPLSNPGEPGKLSLGIIRGSLQVSGYDGDEVIIRYGGDVDEDDDEEREVTRDGLRRISGNSTGFEVQENDNNVEISSVSPMRAINFDISVPRNFSLQLSVVHGDDLTIENINGELEISHVNGDVTLNNVGGSASVNTVNGDITASFQAVAGDKPMAFSNVNGDIDVTLPANAKISAKMKSDWGEVFTDFEMDIRQDTGDRKRSSDSGVFKISVNNWIYGDINGGGPEYLFKSMRGDIYIRKR